MLIKIIEKKIEQLRSKTKQTNAHCSIMMNIIYHLYKDLDCLFFFIRFEVHSAQIRDLCRLLNDCLVVVVRLYPRLQMPHSRPSRTST